VFGYHLCETQSQTRIIFENLVVKTRKTMNKIETELLKIFSHHYDSIYAFTPQDKSKPQWKTKKGRITPEELVEDWQKPNLLVGVGFGKETSYFMLDIDQHSINHPFQTPDGIKSIVHCLEDIGLCRYIIIQSSDSNGIHLYFPLPQAVPTFALANLISEYLTTNSFKIAGGTLEIFPNLKAYVNRKNYQDWTKYQRHRLPLQEGSFILDDNWEIEEKQDLETFLEMWKICSHGQDITTLMEFLEISQLPPLEVEDLRNPCQPTTTKSKKFLTDLNETIKRGWTDFHQTNFILRRIGAKGVVFERLGGVALIDYLEKVAVSLPGYSQYCRHRHEIRTRCRDWAKFCEKHYAPLGYQQPITKRLSSKSGLNNLEKQDDAQNRITQAIRELLEDGKFPSIVRERAIAICEKARCSQQTLYKYKDLWHPDWLSEEKIVCNTLSDQEYSQCYTPLLNEHIESSNGNKKKRDGQQRFQLKSKSLLTIPLPYPAARQSETFLAQSFPQKASRTDFSTLFGLIENLKNQLGAIGSKGTKTYAKAKIPSWQKF
jgi:hypothetical protein